MPRVKPEELQFLHLNASNGLAFNDVYAATVDQHGYTWFATRDGLSRFDGVRTTNFKHIPGDSTSLPNNYLGPISVDDENKIWVTHYKGMSYFDETDNRFHHLPIPHHQTNIPERMFVGSVLPEKNKIWFTDYNSLCCYDKLTQQVKRWQIFNDNVNRSGLGNLYNDGERIWLGSFFGVYIFDKRTQSFEHYDHPVSNTITCFYKDDKQNMWVGTWGDGLCLFDQTTKQFSTSFLFNKDRFVPGTDNIVLSITAPPPFLAADSCLLLGSAKGLALFNTTTHQFQFLSYDEKNVSGISSNYLKANYVASQKTLWLLTSNGVDYTNPFLYQIRKRRFTSLNAIKTFYGISQVAQGNGDEMWLGVDQNGLMRWNKKTNEVKTFFQLRTVISSMVMVSKDVLLLGTASGLVHFNLLTEKFEPISTVGSQKPGYVSFIKKKEQDTYYIGTYRNGLWKYDAGTRHLEEVALPDSIRRTEMADILENSNGVVWLGTFNKGMVRWQGNNIQLFNAASKNHLPVTAVNTIVDGGNYLWLSTSDGLIHFSKKDFSYKQYTEADGLSNTTIYSMVADSKNNLWMATRNGLSMYNVKANRFSTFTSVTGLFTNNLNEWSLLKMTDGSIYLSWFDRLNYFNPLELMENKEPPRLAIQKVKSFQGEIPVSNIIATGATLELPHSQSMLNIEFAVLGYIDAPNNQCAYRLLGLTDEWTNSGTNNIATYANLNPGNYVFELKACNSEGVWTDKPLQLKIYIAPPWWQTWWFRVFVLLLLAAIVYGFIKWRIKAVRKEERVKLQITESELKALRAQMNPHFIFNCMNTIEAHVLKNEPEKAALFIQKFSKLIRMVLDHSRHNLIPLADDIAALKIYVQLERLRFDEAFDVEWDISPTENDGLMIPPLLIQPFVENAILHGLRPLSTRRGKLTVSISQENDMLKVIVDDNGVGRSKTSASKHQSIGSSVTRERIDRLNETHDTTKGKAALVYEDKFDSGGKCLGTKVEVWLPL